MPGLYMVDIIRRNGLEERLIEHDDDPFQFFYLYNKAAAKDPAKPPMFSSSSMAYLRDLDKRSL